MRELRDDCYFDDAALAAMIVAYDLTFSSLPDATPAVRENVAKQIIAAAKQGERDPNVLRQHALLPVQETADELAAQVAIPGLCFDSRRIEDRPSRPG
jgi:hypothetical protein